MAFSDLKKRKHHNFLEKRCAGARQHWEKTLWSLLMFTSYFSLFFYATATVEDSLSDHNGKLFSAWNGFPANRDCARKYGGGWWYLYINEVCTANWNLNSICPHSGSNCTIQWAKLTPEADKNDPKTFEMKIRPADFSYSPWGTRNFFFGRIFLLNNCLYEIIYQILLQDSVMFSGGLIKFFTIYQATWLI